MRSLLSLVTIVPILMFGGLAGCDDDPVAPSDREAPAVPRGLTSITGDGEVELRWFPNGERDLHAYRIYRAADASEFYERIAWKPASGGGVYQEIYVDGLMHPLQNGHTYYYAVSAVDYSGNESDLSWENVFDTPRPEGWGVEIGNYYDSTVDCAYDFSRERVTDFEDLDADIAYTWDDENGGWMIGLDDPDTGYVTELQGAGFGEMDDVTWAPPDGWSPLAAVELVEGHVYVAWTRDDHYAKFRITRIRSHEVEFDWAYQTAPGNQELSEGEKPNANGKGTTPRRKSPVPRRR